MYALDLPGLPWSVLSGAPWTHTIQQAVPFRVAHACHLESATDRAVRIHHVGRTTRGQVPGQRPCGAGWIEPAIRLHHDAPVEPRRARCVLRKEWAHMLPALRRTRIVGTNRTFPVHRGTQQEKPTKP